MARVEPSFEAFQLRSKNLSQEKEKGFGSTAGLSHSLFEWMLSLVYLLR